MWTDSKLYAAQRLQSILHNVTGRHSRSQSSEQFYMQKLVNFIRRQKITKKLSFLFFYLYCMFQRTKKPGKNSCHIRLHMKAVTQDKATRNTLPSLLRGFVTRLQHAPSLVDLMLLWFDYLKLGFTALKHTSKHMPTYADAVRCW